MNSENLLRELIKQGESELLEFKVDVRNETVAKTICGFLNGEGGQLLIGISDRGKIIGLNNAHNYIKELQQYLIDNIIPEPAVTVIVEQLEEKNILAIKVWGGSKKPYVFNGTIFYRRGSSTVQASSKEISNLIHDRQLTEIHWERQPVLGAELEDLDEVEIQKTITYINKSDRGKQLPSNITEFLKYYSLYQNGQLTNAAILLFGREPIRFIPQCRIRFSVFSNGKTGSTFIDDRYLEGNLFKNIDDIQDILKKHIALSSEFKKTNWQRTDNFIYPMDALREGTLNAIIHSDYSNISGAISIQIYPDKLEITNYGKLPNEIKLSDLKKNHPSFPHNPDIAHICFLRGYIEKIGRGTLKIIEACKSIGLKEPKWVSKQNIMTLRFSSSQKKQKEIFKSDLNERQIRFLNEFKHGTKFTVLKYLEFIGGKLTDRSARNDLTLLIDGGWLLKQGKGRNTVYVRTEVKEP
ncbi:MAG: putative DNA binding domain-containing protein [Bacteroidota bacterium]|nr:putative DNA binding domain-containing protein [Bacteroidota bacterium]